VTQLLKQGLEISLIGMGLTFAVLGLLVLMMMLLERSFRRAPAVEPERRRAAASKKAGTHEDEIVVAIGVAVTLLQELERDQAGLGSTLGTGHGAWWAQGRTNRTGYPASRGSARSGGQ